MYTIEERIFSKVLKADDHVRENRLLLQNDINEPTAFKNEWFIFYTMIYLHGQRIINFTENFLRIYMTTQKTLFINHSAIEWSEMSTDAETDIYDDFVEKCVTVLIACKARDIAEDDFLAAITEYKMLYVKKETTQVLETSCVILNEGVRIGNKHMQDYTDMKEYMYKQLTKIDNVLSKSKNRGCVVYGINDESMEADTQVQEVCKFYIPQLDKYATIMEKDMVNIIAPSKCGKSRFCMQIATKACLDGVNVGVWSLENGFDGAESMFRARLFVEKYYENNKKFLRGFDSEKIRKKKLSKDLEKQEEACWLNFKLQSQKGFYGKFCNVEETFSFDNYLEVIERYTDMYDIKLWIIDYPGLITEGTRGKGLKNNELISKLYIETKQFINRKKIAIIFPAQFKQEVIDNMARLKKSELKDVDLRTSCGLSFEIFKTADINLCLYATLTDLKNYEEKILYVPSRNFQAFDPIDMQINLGTCLFIGMDT